MTNDEESGKDVLASTPAEFCFTRTGSELADSLLKAETVVADDEEREKEDDAKALAMREIEERRVTRQIDTIILPLTAITCLLAFLDRGNLGNAKLQGLVPDILNGSSTEYAVILAAFFISYIIFNIPCTILSHKISPYRSIALGCFIWGCAASAQAVTNGFGGLLTCRLVVGFGEALFGPACPLYLSIWYPRNHLGKRLAVFAAAGPLAGMISGSIAAAIQNINSHLATWRILFLIEGAPSIIFAFVIFYGLPQTPQTTTYLTEADRAIVVARLRRDGLIEKTSRFDWTGGRRAATDWKTYAFALMFAGVNLVLASASGFLPTIIKTMHHLSSEAQMLTIWPYLVALFVMIIVCYISDSMQKRGVILVASFCTTAIGFGILLTTTESMALRYFACFLILSGGYSSLALGIAWISNNCGSSSQKAVALPLANVFAQTFSILASFLFPDSSAPRYIFGFSMCLGFSLVSALTCVGLVVYFEMENARRHKLQRGIRSPEDAYQFETLHDLAPSFRYVA